MTNLFTDLPANPGAEELFATLLQRRGVRIERIVSFGHASPPGFWYDQHQLEWVILLRGAAVLRFEDRTETRPLRPGDYVTIEAHRRHRVEATSTDEPSVWLAIHCDG